MVPDDDVRYQITPDGLERLKHELEALETGARRAMADRIRTAREWGDLKENAEYHDAKDAQAHLETRIKVLRDRVRNAVVVETAAGGATVALGSVAIVRDEGSGAERRYTLVSASESAPADGRVSVDSPLGRALAGAAAGEVVEVAAPRGARRLRVLAVE